MGNVFTQNEEPYKTSKQRDTHRISDKVVSFAKSKDYLRIYIAKEGDTVQKIFTDRDKKKVKKHTLVTRVTRKMFKKTSKVYILHKNIDALLYFIAHNKIVIFAIYKLKYKIIIDISYERSSYCICSKNSNW